MYERRGETKDGLHRPSVTAAGIGGEFPEARSLGTALVVGLEQLLRKRTSRSGTSSMGGFCWQ